VQKVQREEVCSAAKTALFFIECFSSVIPLNKGIYNGKEQWFFINCGGHGAGRSFLGAD